MKLVGDHVLQLLAATARVHETEAGAGLGRDVCYRRLALGSMHVVDDVGAGCDGESGGRGAVSVDGDCSLRFLHQLLDHRKHPVLLFGI